MTPIYSNNGTVAVASPHTAQVHVGSDAAPSIQQDYISMQPGSSYLPDDDLPNAILPYGTMPAAPLFMPMNEDLMRLTNPIEDVDIV